MPSARARAQEGFESGSSRGWSSAARAEWTSTRTSGRLRSDSDSDVHDKTARGRRREPRFEGVELLDGSGMVATDAPDENGPVEAPARAGRPQRTAARAPGRGRRVRAHPEAVAAACAAHAQPHAPARRGPAEARSAQPARAEAVA